MAGATSTTIAWLATCILPHEASVRRWLIASGTSPDEAEDLIQDAYCRLRDLSSVDHITAPRAYFFRIIQSLRQGFRRQRIVRFDALTEIHASSIVDEREDPERITDARRQLATVSAVLDGRQAGIEPSFPLVTSPGFESWFPAHDPATVSAALVAANPELRWADTVHRGYGRVVLRPPAAHLQWCRAGHPAPNGSSLSSVQHRRLRRSFR